jgi:hypothetical protein
MTLHLCFPLPFARTRVRVASADPALALLLLGPCLVAQPLAASSQSQAHRGFAFQSANAGRGREVGCGVKYRVGAGSGRGKASIAAIVVAAGSARLARERTARACLPLAWAGRGPMYVVATRLRHSTLSGGHVERADAFRPRLGYRGRYCRGARAQGQPLYGASTPAINNSGLHRQRAA